MGAHDDEIDLGVPNIVPDTGGGTLKQCRPLNVSLYFYIRVNIRNLVSDSVKSLLPSHFQPFDELLFEPARVERASCSLCPDGSTIKRRIAG